MASISMSTSYLALSNKNVFQNYRLIDWPKHIGLVSEILQQLSRSEPNRFSHFLRAARRIQPPSPPRKKEEEKTDS
jgi:hypothetical protein